MSRAGSPAAGRNRLARLRRPERIVVAGASATRPTMGRRLLAALRRTYQGDLVALHPHASEIDHVRCVPEFAALAGRPVDLVVVAVPAAGVPALLAEATTLDPAAVLVLSAMPAEVLAAAVTAAIGGPYDPARHPWFIGPGSNGYLSGGAGLAVTSNPSVRDVPVTAGGVLVLGQSGGLALSALWEPMRRAGVPAGMVLTTGTQAVLPWWVPAAAGLRDGGFDAVAVLAEEVPPAGTLAALGALSHTHQVPLYVLHIGRTSAGGAVAQSHSGALATPGRLFEAACLGHGVRPARSLPELIDLLGAAPTTRGHRPAPPPGGIAVVSPSGGALSYALDQLAPAAPRLALLDDETLRRLAPLLDPSVSPRNPLDLGAAAATDPGTLRDAVWLLLADPAVHRVVVVLAASAGLPEVAAALAAPGASAGTTTPIDLVCLGAGPADIAQVRAAVGPATRLRIWSDLAAVAAGLVVEPRLSVVSVVEEPGAGAASGHGAAGEGGAAGDAAGMAAATALVAGWPAGARTEAEGAELLRLLGIGRPREALLTPAEAARDQALVTAAEQVPLPWVIKGMAAGVTHKRAAGLVVAGVHTLAEARARIRELPDRVTGVLLQEQLRDYGTEFLLTVRHHPALGPHLVFGIGGSAVEQTDRVGIRLLPASPEEVARLIKETDPDPPAEWLHDLLRTVFRLEELVRRAGTGDAELTIELNPVVRHPRTGRLVALDVLGWRPERAGGDPREGASEGSAVPSGGTAFREGRDGRAPGG